MRKVNATQHARIRMQQRAISEMQVRLIQEFGQYEYQKGGEHIAYISEKTLSELRHAIDKLQGLAIVSGTSDCVVTALHLHKRVHKTKYVA